MNSKTFTDTFHKSTYHEPEQSDLVPGATRWWDLEYAQPKWEYPDYDGFVTEPDGTWKKCFRFKLEEAKLEEFEEEVSNYKVLCLNCLKVSSYAH